MIYYIINKKANNFSKTSDFTVTITNNSFYICFLFVSVFFIFYLLRLYLLYLDE